MVLYWAALSLPFLHLLNFSWPVKEDCLLESKGKDELKMRSERSWVRIGQVAALGGLFV